MIGGGGERKTLRFVARYAQACNLGEKGERSGQVVDQLGALAEMGFQAAIGAVARVWEISPLEIIGSEVIPAVSGL
jgi:hypothetical protein